ncbi:MAG: pentapeptide repeat-containing protein, partial [Pseudomonadota bacterium]
PGRDLRRANLTNAFLADADLQGARLEGADLREARLEGADLRGARLEGADLGGARLEEAVGEGTIHFRRTADMRYLVLPRRPEGTEGWSADRLAALVGRDCMIGTGLAATP